MLLCALGQPLPPPWARPHQSTGGFRWILLRTLLSPCPTYCPLQVCRRQLRRQAQAGQWTQSHRGHWPSQRQPITQWGWQRSAEQEEKDNSCACCHSSFSICQLGGAGRAALSN